MKQKTIVLIALAVVCGLGASFMTSKLLADRQQQEETIKVLVAKKNLDTGIMIKKPEEMFEEKEILKETAPKNVLQEMKDVKNRQLKIPRRQGDTITQDDLYDDKGPGLHNTLPPGHRAVGIRVSSEQIAAGFAAVPHSRIDIACSMKGSHDKENVTRIILQNVLVLASGQATVRDDGGKPMMCDVVTVALTPYDCLKLEVAKAKGGLTMFLRPFGESTFVKTPGVTMEDLTRNKKGEDQGDDPDDKEAKTIGTAPQDLPAIPPSQVTTSVQLNQPVVNDKFIQRITNETTVKYIYTKHPEGHYETRVEPVVATPPTDPASSPTPTPTTTQAPPKGPTPTPTVPKVPVPTPAAGPAQTPPASTPTPAPTPKGPRPVF